MRNYDEIFEVINYLMRYSTNEFRDEASAWKASEDRDDAGVHLDRSLAYADMMGALAKISCKYRIKQLKDLGRNRLELLRVQLLDALLKLKKQITKS